MHAHMPPASAMQILPGLLIPHYSLDRLGTLYIPHYSVFQVGCPEEIKNGSWLCLYK